MDDRCGPPAQTPNFVFGYDALSRRNSLARPNGVNTTYGYDPVSRLLGAVHKLGTTVLDGVVYTYDNAGNRLTRLDKRTNVTLTYGYDHIYQLQTAKQGTTTKESYTYDLVGNRLSSLGVSPYNYNTSNELTSTPSGNYTYDSNGNEKSKPDGTTYFWDSENRLTQVILPGSGGTVNFKYDPFGRRAQKAFTQGSTTTTTDYVYDGMALLEETDQSENILARYTQGAAADEPLAEVRSGTTSYYEQDGLGSISSLSSTSGTLANTYTYDSYGILGSSSGTITNPFQYTGRDYDPETGLRYYRARYYDQNIGRFLNEDPARSGPNYYAYVSNRPTRSVDPSGLCKVELRFWKLGPNWYHAYVVLTNPDGSQYYFRGGPSAGGPSSGNSGGVSAGASGSASGSSSGSSNSSNSSNSSSPGASPGGGGNYDPWGPVRTRDGEYVPGTIDWDPGTPPSEVLRDDDGSCQCVIDKMKSYSNGVNSANIPYNPFSTNSNAFAFGAARAAGFSPPPPPVWAPGSGTPLAVH